VTACQNCGKHLASFYFFDESRAMGLEARQEESEPVLPHREYPPVLGLTAYWESDTHEGQS
jgi:hypothetical protein